MSPSYTHRSTLTTAALVCLISIFVEGRALGAPGSLSFDWTTTHGPGQTLKVTLDACASTQRSGNVIPVYEWSIDGSIVATTRSCKFVHEVPREGEFNVSLKVSSINKTIERKVVVQDWVIVSLGDSYASGEGVPDREMSPTLFGELNDAQQNLNQSIAAASGAQNVISLTNQAIANVDDLISCLGWDSSQVLGVEVPRPRACTVEMLVGVPPGPGTTTYKKLQELNSILAQLGLSSISMSLRLLNPLTAMKSGLAQLRATQQALLDAVDVWRALRDSLALRAPALWKDERCHRSTLSGPALAAQAIEDMDPHTSVTFIDLACSGAQIDEGLLNPYAGRKSGANPLKSQVLEAAERIGGREIDAMMISIGGNDAGFSNIAIACIVQNSCSSQNFNVDTFNAQLFCGSLSVLGVSRLDQNCADFDKILKSFTLSNNGAALIFQNGLAQLPGRYQKLRDRLVQEIPKLGTSPGRVFITEYPNATQDQSGRICGPQPASPLISLPGVTPTEWQWVLNTVTKQLNNAVQSAATQWQWTYVGGSFSGYKLHGYCSSSSWFVRVQESFERQGDVFGSVHPTAQGNQLTAQLLTNALLSQLYQGSNISKPRLPE